MISISFIGIASIIILLPCVALLAMHRVLLKYRAPIDEHLATLDELLREQLEGLGYDASGDLHDLLDSEAYDEIAHDPALAAAVQAYNDSLPPYNHFVSRFPGKLMAGITGLAPEDALPL